MRVALKEETQMKKRIIITALSVMLASSSIIPAYAAEPMKWNIDPNTYNAKEYGGINWMLAESLAATKVWAEGYREQLAAITADMDKFEAIVKIVCDTITYDESYATLVDNYTYRDGKGVCEDYARSVMALCQVAGIPCTYETGYAYGYAHGWNKVTLSGVDYYSDITSYDKLGDTALKLSATLWSDHEYRSSITEMDINTVANSFNTTYTDGGNMPDPGSNLKKMIGKSGKVVYVTKEDSEAFANNTITAAELIAKYPDLG